jgi:hypothetical protein
MIANRMKPVLFAAALAASLTSVATARDQGPQTGDFNSSHGGPYYPGYGYHGHRGQLKLFSDQRLGGASRVVTASSNDSIDDGSVVSPAYSGSRYAGGDYYGAVSYGGSVSGSAFVYINGSRTVYADFAAPQTDGPYIAPKAKIIDVTEASAQDSFKPIDGCSYEKGVCVIRGR